MLRSTTQFRKWFEHRLRVHGIYRQNSNISNVPPNSNISCTFTGNKLVYHSHVFGATPIGAAPTSSSFSTKHLGSIDWATTTATGDKNHFFFNLGRLVLESKRYPQSAPPVSLLWFGTGWFCHMFFKDDPIYRLPVSLHIKAGDKMAVV